MRSASHRSAEMVPAALMPQQLRQQPHHRHSLARGHWPCQLVELKIAKEVEKTSRIGNASSGQAGGARLGRGIMARTMITAVAAAASVPSSSTYAQRQPGRASQLDQVRKGSRRLEAGRLLHEDGGDGYSLSAQLIHLRAAASTLPIVSHWRPCWAAAGAAPWAAPGQACDDTSRRGSAVREEAPSPRPPGRKLCTACRRHCPRARAQASAAPQLLPTLAYTLWTTSDTCRSLTPTPPETAAICGGCTQAGQRDSSP